MNFTRAKSYLIVFFILVNLFLAYNLYKISNSGEITKETVNNTVSILKNKGIKFDPSVIKEKNTVMFNLNLSNPLSDIEKFSENLKGEVSIGEDGFVYYPDFDFEVKTKLISSKTSDKIVSSLKDMGLSVKYLDWIGTIQMGNNNYRASYIQSYDRHSIYNTYIQVFFNDKKITKVMGIYYDLNSFTPTEKELKSPYEILIKFSSDTDLKNISIKSIENGYFTQDFNKEYKELSALPCYKITINNSEMYYYDAINGNLLKTEIF